MGVVEQPDQGTGKSKTSKNKLDYASNSKIISKPFTKHGHRTVLEQVTS